MIIKREDGEKEGIRQAVNLMLVSARTAPKSGGKDDIYTAYIEGDIKNVLASEMENIGKDRNIAGFIRDAKNVNDSDFVVLIGVSSTKSFGANCGACGYKTCQEFNKAKKKKGNDFTGPSCHFKILDLGIALCSAVKTASNLNIDNRIMYRVGVAAKKMKILPKTDVICGIPISSRAKNIYFDRSSH
jgi:uncharacterized ferredoxin-like protein